MYLSIDMTEYLGQKNFYNRTLIKLQRQYKKDEVVAMLTKKLEEAEQQIADLNSELSEIKQKPVLTSQEKNEINRLARIEAKKGELFVQKEKECEKLKADIKRLRNSLDVLLAKQLKSEKMTLKKYIMRLWQKKTA